MMVNVKIYFATLSCREKVMLVAMIMLILSIFFYYFIFIPALQYKMYWVLQSQSERKELIFINEISKKIISLNGILARDSTEPSTIDSIFLEIVKNKNLEVKLIEVNNLKIIAEFDNILLDILIDLVAELEINYNIEVNSIDMSGSKDGNGYISVKKMVLTSDNY